MRCARGPWVSGLTSLTLLLACVPQGYARPRFAASLGLDRSWIRQDEAVDGSARTWRWAPTAALAARWRLGRLLEFEPGLALSAVGRQDRWVLLTTAQGGTVLQTVRTPFTVKQTIHAVELPIRLRFMPGARTGAFADAALVPAYQYSADLQTAFGTSSTAAASAPRRASPEAVIFETVGSATGLRASLYPWDLRVSAGAGWRFAVAGHGVDAALRWDEGVVDIRRRGLPQAHTRVMRAVVSLAL